MKVSDLNWVPHCNGGSAWQATHTFPNGYGISVLKGTSLWGHIYTDGGTYEVAILGGDDNLCYDTPITSDVLGWQTEEEVNAILAAVEALATYPAGNTNPRKKYEYTDDVTDEDTTIKEDINPLDCCNFVD